MGAYDDAEATAQAPAHQQQQRQVSEPSRILLLFNLLLRIAALVLSIIVIAVMVNAKQRVMIFEAQWHDSKAFVALVVISAITLGYSFIQSILAIFHLRSKSPTKVWAATNFIGDQILTYAMLGAAAASAELAYIAKNGASQARWNPICSTFNTFCTRAGASIILSFIAVLTLASSAAISAYHLFRSR